MYRTKAGIYEEDFRRKGISRLHVSYGRVNRKEADAASSAMRRIFREGRVELIEKVRRGDVTPHELAAIIEDERPLSLAGTALAAGDWPKLGDAAKDYIDWLKTTERRSKGTWRPAQQELDRFLAFVSPDTPIDQIAASKVTEYQKHLKEKGYKQNTVVTSVWRVSGLFTWLQRQEKRRAQEEKRPPRHLASPIDEDEISTRHTRRDRALTEAEAERLLAATPMQLLFPVMCGLLEGLRIEEMLHLRPQHDVDVDLGLLTIQEQPDWHPKNRKRRVVPMAPQLLAVAQYHLERFASEQWMLPSPVFDDRPMNATAFGNHFRRIVKNAELVPGRADPNGVVFHTLRHTFASWLVMKGVDLYTVSQLMGNSLKMVESTYSHLAPDYRQRALDRLAGIVAIPALPADMPQTGAADPEAAA